jgi:hypothetical protein
LLLLCYFFTTVLPLLFLQPILVRSQKDYFTLLYSALLCFTLLYLLQPILATLTRLQATANLRSEEARFQLIGVARDVRGITCATNRRLFPVMFDLLYPACLPVFTRAIDTWYDALRLLYYCFTIALRLYPACLPVVKQKEKKCIGGTTLP